MQLHRLALITVVLALFAPLALAQPAPPRDPALRTITVSGDAEVRVPPDNVQFSFTIGVDDKDIDKARAQIDERSKKLLALLRQQGLDAKDIQTDYLSIEPRFEERGGIISSSREFAGYFATRRVSVTLRDLTKFETVVAEALKLGVTGFNQGEFRTSKLREQRDRARILATQAASEKAKAIAGELGATVGKPLTISERIVYPSAPANRVQSQNAAADPNSGDGDSLAPGEVVIRAHIDVVFLLE